MNRSDTILSLGPQVRFVAGKIYRRLPQSILFDDLISEGWIGAIKAVDGYTPGGKATLATYANTKINGAILDYLRGLDHVSRNVRRKYNTAIAKYSPEDGPVPVNPGLVMSIEEIRWTADPKGNAGFIQAELRIILATLSPRERAVVMSHDLAGETFASIGKGMGVTEGRVFQVRTAALAKLRAA